MGKKTVNTFIDSMFDLDDNNPEDLIQDNITESTIQDNIQDNICESTQSIKNIETEIETEEEIIIGIDLGTTNTCCGIWRDGNVEIIPDENGNRTIPSYVAFTNVNRYIGNDAKNQKELNPNNVFYEIKRLIGRKIDDPLFEREKEYISYKLCSDENNNVLLESDINNNKKFTPEELQACILSKIKQMASNYLHKKITKAVITIPAYFNDGQRQATKDAAKIAGLDCIRMINEPTAAGLAYGMLKRSIYKIKKLQDDDAELKVLVYDFGGGTLDVAYLIIQNGLFEVVASSGNTRLGGSDFDNRLMSYAIAKFKYKNHIADIEYISKLSLQKLRTSCEQAKKLLSTVSHTHIAVQNFYNDIDLFVSISRIDMEKICGDLFLLALKPVEDVLKDNDIDVEDIDEVILIGGMTRMPKIKELLKTKFKKDPNCSINPEEAVATGAAIQAYMISNQDDPFSDSITIQDSTALSLGVETIGGIMDVIIPKSSPIPALGNKLYTTDQDYVDTITVKIYEGERSLTKYNFFVGEFDLSGIKPALRGIPEIEVHIKIDENGIINVVAENLNAEEDQTSTNSIVVTSHKGRLTQEQLAQFIEEASDMEARDELEKRRKLMHYELDDFCNNIIMNIKRDENKIPTEKIFKISESDTKYILDDINGIISWMNEKKYYEREDEDYTKILDRLKSKYGVLILKGSLEETKDVKQINDSNKNATGIYDDENGDGENMDDIFEKIEEEQMGIIGMTDTQKAEIKEIRKALSDLCYSINEVLDSDKLAINNDHIKELRDYIDDTLLWIYTHDQPSKAEYKMKIDEVNEQCDIVFKHYENEGKDVFNKNAIVESIKNNRDELENLCITLKLLLLDNAIPNNKKTESLLIQLTEKINNTLVWIYSTDEEQDKNMENYYSECNKKLNEINEMCDSIYQKTQGIYIDSNTIVPKKEDIVLTGYIESNNEEKEMGTSIIDIMRNKQKDIMLEMIQTE